MTRPLGDWSVARLRDVSLALLLAAAALPLFGAGLPEASRYIVTTREGAKPAGLMLGREISIRPLESLSGFIAELTEAEVEQLKKSPHVLFIEPDVRCYAIGANRDNQAAPSPVAMESTQQIPYGVAMVEAPRVWAVGRGSGIHVGVIDTGILTMHPDLLDSYRGGYDFVNEDADPDDEHGHGTHVAGTIGAVDNDFGVIGVAPGVELYALKVLDDTGSGRGSNVIRAIDWAISNRMRIINMSLGFDAPLLSLDIALRRADAAGILAVAAAGNDYKGVDGLAYPAGFSTVLSVGAIDDAKNIASFSQRGSALKLVAPGVQVLSLSQSEVKVTAHQASYDALLMEGSPLVSLSGTYVFSGLGYAADFTEAVRGNIALIQRGEITFREKVTHAKNAGAVAAVIYNNVPGPFRGTLIRDQSGAIIPDAAAFAWPLTVSISREDGEALRQKAPSELSVSARVGGYEQASGTSMASPHVAGVAAVIWSVAPQATIQQVRQALLSGAADLGASGFDTTFGFGLVNAYEAARLLASEKFESGRERIPQPERRGRRIEN